MAAYFLDSSALAKRYLQEDGTLWIRNLTARKSFSITIHPARPLVITNQSDALAPGQVGVSYATGVFADGGVPPYRWSLVAGQLPPGLSLTTSPGRITGTPTAAGTFTFTLRVADNGGQTATRQFSITVAP